MEVQQIFQFYSVKEVSSFIFKKYIIKNISTIATEIKEILLPFQLLKRSFNFLYFCWRLKSLKTGFSWNQILTFWLLKTNGTLICVSKNPPKWLMRSYHFVLWTLNRRIFWYSKVFFPHFENKTFVLYMYCSLKRRELIILISY